MTQRIAALAALTVLGLAAQSEPPPLPPGVKLIADIAYDTKSPAQALDLYLPEPAEAAGPRPAIVFVHGGGWRSGDKGDGLWREGPASYAAEGYVTISVNYRLTGEAPFPAQIHDVKCAVRWLRANAEKYQVDPDRIGAFGNSAGAHLVSLLALVRPEDGLEGDGPYGDYSSAVQAVVSSATPTDFEYWPLDWDSVSAVSGLLGEPLAEASVELKRRASPTAYVRADAPPLLFVHGTADRTVPPSQTDRLVLGLRKAGDKQVRSMIFNGEGHDVFKSKKSLTYKAMREFFKDKLGASSPTASR